MDYCGRWHHPAVALLLAMPTFADQHTSCHMFQDATQIPFIEVHKVNNPIPRSSWTLQHMIPK